MPVVIKHDSSNAADACSLFQLDEIRAVTAPTADSENVMPAPTAAAAAPNPEDAIPSTEHLEKDRGAGADLDDPSQLRTLETVVKSTVDEVQRMQQQWHAEADQQVLRLAVAIAERIIRRQLEQQPSISSQWIRDSLELVSSSSRIRICLHPDDCQRLAGQVEQIIAEVARIVEFEVTADATVSPGGCRVESEHGLVDQCVEAQLQRILQELEFPSEAEF
jgi:flagellar biosynthesis/type III secretory pathway protein FliH